METVNFDDLQLKANERILDLGCGEGRHAITAYMLANVESVVGKWEFLSAGDRNSQ